MKYSIGYQLPDEFFSTYELCKNYADAVSEVYFSYSDEPSGRFTLKGDNEEETAQIANLQLEELGEIKKLGKSLTLLYNANCYGEKAISFELKKHVLSRTEFLKNKLDIDCITTTSPFIAEIIKEAFRDDIKIRASVNMKIGSVSAMEQLADFFDGYYLQKEYNRNFKVIKELKNWCEKTANLYIF